MEIKEITEKKIWQDFLNNCQEKTFLQSWNWGEFQLLMNNKIWRFGIYEKGHLISIVLIVKNIAKRGTFLLIPHGPIIIDNKLNNFEFKKNILDVLLKKIKIISKQENASFIRIAPIWKRIKENEKIFNDYKFIKSSMLIHLEATWQLDITPNEENLFKNMRKTTRYLIKKAQENKDIEIIKSDDLNDVKIFSQLHNSVSLRQKFIPFSLKFLENEFLSFNQDSDALIFKAKYQGKIVGSCFVVFDSNKAYYHHSALLSEFSKIPVVYLLIWEAIKEAKNRGCVIFDFWGFIDPKIQPNHPWAGPTLFKMGFGGQNNDFVESKDLPISFKYWFTYIFEKIRKLKRGL